MICEKWLNCAVLPHEHRNDLFVSDNEEIRDIGMFIKDDSIIQTLSGKSYGHKSEKASIYAHFYSLKQVSKLFISRDIDDFASGDFSYLGPLIILSTLLWSYKKVSSAFCQLGAIKKCHHHFVNFEALKSVNIILSTLKL